MDTYTKQPHPNALSPQQEVFAWHICDILVHREQYFGNFIAELGEPSGVNEILVHKTEQVPCHTMNIKLTKYNGNIEVMEELLRQGGLGDAGDVGFDMSCEVDMSEHVILVHGDLLTKEHLNSVHKSRSIEETPKNRFQYLIFLPGLFHYKMACVDALFHTYLQPKGGWDDENSLYQHVGILHPDKIGKMTSKPGFQRMHEVVHHNLWAAMLDCWRVEAQNQNQAWTTLELFAKAKPSWDTIIQMSRAIVCKYVAHLDGLDKAHSKPAGNQDKRFENQVLQNHDGLLYVDLCQAINAGDIRRVEASFLPWIYIFKATGKHKYATHMMKFLINMNYNYPTAIQEVVKKTFSVT
ncbi:hypothetical protein PAXRUDRAFT_169448 [Paxillus rubicundulus Ve08.2h10]|uniref:DUF6589 domain-containing protein n=1 Tax=Paxillus rubicundulus Ve08.2h10 TaxID=930991 RepID=A0A0D0CZ88_9AGAM|nr:hypothetical protein PAXRUDRAFT_169448 [Paxillus rubicundulus Ve08.2h10]